MIQHNYHSMEQSPVRADSLSADQENLRHFGIRNIFPFTKKLVTRPDLGPLEFSLHGSRQF
jgi:hypothetical protein